MLGQWIVMKWTRIFDYSDIHSLGMYLVFFFGFLKGMLIDSQRQFMH